MGRYLTVSARSPATFHFQVLFDSMTKAGGRTLHRSTCKVLTVCLFDD